MNSCIVGHVELNRAAVVADVDCILASPTPSQNYSEYRFGTFITYILRSYQGTADGLFRGARGKAERSVLGASLRYIEDMVERTFATDRLQMMRAYLLQDALLLPHCDYVEFKKDAARMVRLHVPLVTNPRALHSEEDTVYHMRVGEVWYLDVTRVHSACNGANLPRVSLVLDFLLDGAPIGSVFRDPSL